MSPSQLALLTGGALIAPSIFDTTMQHQQGLEKNMMELHQDPTRVIDSDKVATRYNIADAPKMAAPSFLGGIGSGIKDTAISSFTTGIGEGIGKGLVEHIFNAVGSAFKGVHNAIITQPKQQGVLQQVITQDPIIADAIERNPNASKLVEEAYATLLHFAPSLASDINAVKTFLREAVLSGSGVNYATIKGLIETERAQHGGVGGFKHSSVATENLDKTAALEESIISSIPEGVKNAVRTQGFHKVAGALYGIDFDNDYEVLKNIGTKIAMRYLEQKSICEGLESLVKLQQEA